MFYNQRKQLKNAYIYFYAYNTVTRIYSKHFAQLILRIVSLSNSVTNYSWKLYF